MITHAPRNAHIEYFADVVDDAVFHASMTCEENQSLLELVECHLDGDFSDPGALHDGAAQLGMIVPDWVADMMVPCHRCASHLRRGQRRRAA